MRKRLAQGLLIATLTAALVAAFGAGPASAHAKLVSTSPAKGGTAKLSLKAVRAVFNQQIRRGTLKIYFVKTGKQVSKGSGGRDPRNLKRLAAQMKGGLKAGQYVAKWTIVAADGDAQKGSFKFKLKK